VQDRSFRETQPREEIKDDAKLTSVNQERMNQFSNQDFESSQGKRPHSQPPDFLQLSDFQFEIGK
jgi:hypothetical protein